MNRVRTLSQKDGLVNDEKIQDTLLDLANYAILAVLELEGEDNGQIDTRNPLEGTGETEK